MGHSFPGGQCPIRPATWCPRRRLSHGGRPRRQSVLSLRVPLATSGGGTAVIVPFLNKGAEPGEAGRLVPRPQVGAVPRASDAPASGWLYPVLVGSRWVAFPRQGHPGELPDSVTAAGLRAQPLKFTHPWGIPAGHCGHTS